MSNLKEFECDLIELKSFAKNLAINANIGDIYLLCGDLGSGKTTFSRFFINSLYEKYKKNLKSKIKSPSYPLLINYPLLNFEINHYDLYRLKNLNELSEIDFFENFKKNITLIEWPEIVIQHFKFNKYYLINFNFIDSKKRKIIFNKFLKDE